jgi:hypothetical protein
VRRGFILIDSRFIQLRWRAREAGVAGGQLSPWNYLDFSVRCRHVGISTLFDISTQNFPSAKPRRKMPADGECNIYFYSVALQRCKESDAFQNRQIRQLGSTLAVLAHN